MCYQICLSAFHQHTVPYILYAAELPGVNQNSVSSSWCSTAMAVSIQVHRSMCWTAKKRTVTIHGTSWDVHVLWVLGSRCLAKNVSNHSVCRIWNTGVSERIFQMCIALSAATITMVSAASEPVQLVNQSHSLPVTTVTTGGRLRAPMPKKTKEKGWQLQFLNCWLFAKHQCKHVFCTVLKR